MKRFWLVLCCGLMVFAAMAAQGLEASRHIEASMVVTGWIEIAPDGGVHGYTLDQSDKLPGPVVDIIGKTLSTWRFKPVLIGGRAVLAKARMNLRVLASPLAGDQFRLRVSGVTFGDGDAGASPSFDKKMPPRYPDVALNERTGGTVYLAVLINRQGGVEAAAVQQVDLRTVEPEHDMKVFRKAFAVACLDAVKRWTFKVPITGPEADADHWTVTVPINFGIAGTHQPGYGEWDAYVSGPVQPIPWEQGPVAGPNADAVPDGLALLQDARFVLLTPLGS